MVIPDGFEQQFARLRDEYQAIQNKAEQDERDKAPRFNIFHRFRQLEVWHSAFLADLLDPQGTHGQGDLFLRHFMRYCRSSFGDSAGHVFSPDYDFQTGWKISTEKDIRPFGRLDIVIENPDHGVLIAIENKVEAGEGHHQMRKYGMWIDGLAENYSRQALLLLTPTGRQSDSHGDVPYYPLSYRQNVVAWLESALADPDLSAVRVIGTIAQYLDVIGKETMDQISGLQGFLRQPENLPVAINVAQQLEQLRDELHAQFWHEVEQELRRRLKESPYANEWEIKTPKDGFRRAWVNCHIRPRLDMDKPKVPHARIALQQGTPKGGNNLHYGIVWAVNQNHPQDLPEYQALHRHFRNRATSLRTKGWWILLDGAGYSARGDRFLLRMGTDQDAFIREIVDLPWNLFLDTVDLLAALNRAVQELEYGQ